MKFIKKITVLFLALLMLISTLVACRKTQHGGQQTGGTESDAQGDVIDTTPETNEWGEVDVEHGIPEDLNYNGATVNVIVRAGEAYGREWTTEKRDDSLDIQVYKRNTKVENALGVTFNFIRIADNTQSVGGATPMSDAIELSGKSGGKEYDIINQYRNDAGNTNLLVYYKNLRGADFTYLDLDKPYWSQNFNDTLNSAGKQFYIVGDINLSLWDRAIVVFFNKSKLDVYTDLTDTQLYQMVIDKDWTYETFYNLIKDVHEEKDGVSGTSAGDFVGLASIIRSEASDGLLYSWDVALTQESVDGYHSVVTDAGYTKYINAGQKLLDLYSANGAWLNKDADENVKHFTQGYSLFNIDALYHGATHLSALKEMSDEYGVLPTPMYDETQGEYFTGVQDSHSIMCIMDGNKDFEMLSAVLEMLAYESYNSVRPYYVKTIIKSQNFNDTTSGKMFDIIMDGVTLDFCDMWEGSDPKIRWSLWMKPFQYTMSQKRGGSLTPISHDVCYEESYKPLNDKLNQMDLFLDALE